MFIVKDKDDLLQQSKNEGGDISSMFFTIPEKKRLSESLGAFQSKVKHEVQHEEKNDVPNPTFPHVSECLTWR